jgi:anti-anti-sigma factor
MALIHVTGPLDAAGAPGLVERARSLSRSSACIVISLAQAQFLDSNGVRALLRLAEELEAAGKDLRLVVRPGSRVERTLTLLHLLERFRVYSCLREAGAHASAT